MATYSSIILTFFIICGATITLGLPDDAEQYLRGLPEKTRRFVDRCMTKLTWSCAKEVAGSLYTDNRHVSKRCCKSLKGIGKKCRNVLLAVLINVPELKDKKGIIVRNHEKLLNKCLGKHS